MVSVLISISLGPQQNSDYAYFSEEETGQMLGNLSAPSGGLAVDVLGTQPRASLFPTFSPSHICERVHYAQCVW